MPTSVAQSAVTDREGLGIMARRAGGLAGSTSDSGYWKYAVLLGAPEWPLHAGTSRLLRHAGAGAIDGSQV